MDLVAGISSGTRDSSITAPWRRIQAANRRARESYLDTIIVAIVCPMVARVVAMVLRAAPGSLRAGGIWTSLITRPAN